MTPEQQNSLIFDILKFKMEDGSPISADVRAGVILSQMGISDEIPQLRRLLAIGITRHDQTFKRRQERWLNRAA